MLVRWPSHKPGDRDLLKRRYPIMYNHNACLEVIPCQAPLAVREDPVLRRNRPRMPRLLQLPRPREDHHGPCQCLSRMPRHLRKIRLAIVPWQRLCAQLQTTKLSRAHHLYPTFPHNLLLSRRVSLASILNTLSAVILLVARPSTWQTCRVRRKFACFAQTTSEVKHNF